MSGPVPRYPVGQRRWTLKWWTHEGRQGVTVFGAGPDEGEIEVVEAVAADRLAAENEKLREAVECLVRVRQVITLNMRQMLEAGEPLATNVVDALNDITEHSPDAGGGSV